MNRGRLLKEIDRRLGELKGVRGVWLPEERIDALNDCQVEVVRELSLIRRQATANTVVGQQNYTLSVSFSVTNFMGVLDPGLIYYNGTQDATLTLKTLTWLYTNVVDWRTASNGIPTHYFPPDGGKVIESNLGLYPKPNKAVVSGLRLHYLARPADMTDDNHQPFNLVASATRNFPSLEPFDKALVWKTVSFLLGEENPVMAAKALRSYAAVVSAAGAHVAYPDDDQPDTEQPTRYVRITGGRDRLRPLRSSVPTPWLR